MLNHVLPGKMLMVAVVREHFYLVAISPWLVSAIIEAVSGRCACWDFDPAVHLLRNHRRSLNEYECAQTALLSI